MCVRLGALFHSWNSIISGFRRTGFYNLVALFTNGSGSMCWGHTPLWGPFSCVIKQTCSVRPCWGWTLTPQPMVWGLAGGQQPVVEARTETIFPRHQQCWHGIGSISSSRSSVNSLWRINGSGSYWRKWCLLVSCWGNFTLWHSERSDVFVCWRACRKKVDTFE